MEGNYSPQKKWDKKHPEKRRYINDKSATKRFIRTAKHEDLQVIKELIDQEIQKEKR